MAADVDFQGVGLHAIEVEPGAPPLVSRMAASLERVKSAIETFTAAEVKIRGNANLSAKGKTDALRREAGKGLQVVEGTERLVAEATEDLETRRSSILPSAMVERSRSMDGENAAAVVRREARAAEVRVHVRSLDDMNKVKFFRVLIGEAKEASFDAIVAVASAPVPIKLPSGALEDLARQWFDAHDAERTGAIASVEAAAGVLQAAAKRGRRGLARRQGREEPELARTIG